MPSAYVQKLADEGHGSIAKLEHHWNMAKEAAEDAGRKDDFAYITGIFKKSLGIEASPLKIEAAMRLRASK